MMTEDSARRDLRAPTAGGVGGLVALCFAWIVAGTFRDPFFVLDGSNPWQRVAIWTLLGACPVAFWLGWRFGRVRGALSVLALTLSVGYWTGTSSSALQVHPNDLAALLALLLPWWLVPVVTTSRGELSKRARILSFLAAALCAAALLSTGSRGGLLAAFVGTLAALVLSAHRRGRIAMALVAGGVVLAALLPTASETEIYQTVRGWARDHDAEGPTWRHLGSGRPVLWRQALRVIDDHRLFGIGPGRYGDAVPDVYPPPLRRIDLYDPGEPRTPRVDDAHQLYLESSVAFGVPFAAAFLGLCTLGLARLERARPAAFGGLLAMLLHGLVDCAAPGSMVYVALWAALGHACGRANCTVTPPRRHKLHDAILILTLAAVAASVVYGALGRFKPDPCRDAWRSALVQGSPADAVAVARCEPDRIADLASLAPLDAERANAVLAQRPGHPDAIRWRLWTTSVVSDLGHDLAHGYFQYFARRPRDADAKMEFLRRVDPSWRELHPHTVLALLADACALGDPGANACYGAGNLARRLDLPMAVSDGFYLASEWPPARRLARRTRDETE